MENSFYISLLLVLIIVIHPSLGIFVLSKAPRALLNRLVCGFTLIASLWGFTVLMIYTTSDQQTMLFWMRMAHAVAAFTPWFVLAIVYIFLGNSKQHLFKSKTISFLFLFSLFLAILCLTPIMIENVRLPLEERDYVSGPLFILFPVFFSSVILYTLFKLFYHMRQVRGFLRHQIRFFIGGILLSFVLGSLSNIFLPIIGVTEVNLRAIGPIFSIIMVISITYAIVKYRLMDIRLALGKLIEYAFSVLILAGIYMLFVLSLGHYAGVYLGSPSFYFTLLLIAFAAVFFPILKEKVQLLINRFYYQGLYSYHDTLLEASKAMTSILQQDKLLNYLLDKVVSAMHIERAVFFIREQNGAFAAAAHRSLEEYYPDNNVALLNNGSFLLSYLEREGEVLLKSDLEKMLPVGDKKLLELEMDKLDAQAAVPVIIDSRLEGVFSLGFKMSGEPYFKDDVNLLSTLSYQLAVSLRNSRLYDEVLEIKQYLQNILENMGNGLIAVDAEGEIMTFNRAAEQLTGKPSQEVLGKKAHEVLEQGLIDILHQSLEKGQGMNGQEVEITLGERGCHLSCNTALVEMPNTGEKGVILILSDVTRVKELEREKNQVERLASLGEMAAGIAHEIKNPLVSIKTYAELLPERYSNNEFRHNFSQVVTQEIERINKLIKELLTFARSSGDSLEKIDLVSLMEEVLELLSPQLESQGIELFTSYHREIPHVLADKDRIKQAFFNICLNGIQAMGEGGTLKIELFPSNEEEDKMRTGNFTLTGTPMVKAAIKDTGPGISPQEQEKIFNPFYTTKLDGVGIGLSISHKIITDHGGTVQLYSNSKGTNFEVVLPAAPNTAGNRCKTP